MRQSLFNKAKKILGQEKAKIVLENDQKIFFEVKASNPKIQDHSVIFFYEDHTFKHSCTCMQIAKHDDPTRMCSHKIACMGLMLQDKLVFIDSNTEARMNKDDSKFLNEEGYLE